MRRLWTLLVGVILGCMILQPASAQTNYLTQNEYQDLLIRYSILMGAEDLTAKLETLAYDEWELMYESTPSKGELAKAITDLEKLSQEDAGKSVTSAYNLNIAQAIDPTVTVDGEFEPRYPNVSTNGAYWLWIYPSAYLFAPGGDEAGIQDERCNEHVEAGLRIGHTITWVSAIGLQAICDSVVVALGAGGSFPGSCIAAAVGWEIVAAEEEILKVCEVQTGNADSAEIEAAYENSRTILNEANNMTAILDDETNFTDDIELAAHETAIKKQLTIIKRKLNRQEAKLDKVIQLLLTPQGKRPGWNKKK